MEKYEQRCMWETQQRNFITESITGMNRKKKSWKPYLENSFTELFHIFIIKHITQTPNIMLKNKWRKEFSMLLSKKQISKINITLFLFLKKWWGRGRARGQEKRKEERGKEEEREEETWDCITSHSTVPLNSQVSLPVQEGKWPAQGWNVAMCVRGLRGVIYPGSVLAILPGAATIRKGGAGSGGRGATGWAWRVWGGRNCTWDLWSNGGCAIIAGRLSVKCTRCHVNISDILLATGTYTHTHSHAYACVFSVMPKAYLDKNVHKAKFKECGLIWRVTSCAALHQLDSGNHK